MSSSLAVARWYTRAKNTHLYNSLAQPTKEISIPKPKHQHGGASTTALITTFLIFIIKLPSYIERYSR